MVTDACSITISTSNGVEVKVVLASEVQSSIWTIDPYEATENGESPYQILEGCSYEYAVEPEGFQLKEVPGIVANSRVRRNSGTGRITPRIYVGNLELSIIDIETGSACGTFNLEVRSVKLGYRSDYRKMLEDITEKSVDLLLQHSSPVAQSLAPDFFANSSTLYQRFAFVKSILDSQEFSDAVHRIVTAPVVKWKEVEIEQSVSSIRRIQKNVVKQIASATSRVQLRDGHRLKSTLGTVPNRIRTIGQEESVDTVENRFVKYALESFLLFCADFRANAKGNCRLESEALLLEEKLEQYLSHSVFKSLPSLSVLPLNSPILQRKEGYREVLRSWLMFDLAAKLVWQGGDDVYKGGKRDVAVLYEYWLFFTLLELVGQVFFISPSDVAELIKPTADGLGLQLRQGKYTALEGQYDSGNRKLSVRFCYNRTFVGSQAYPSSGSWTKGLRPDFTLSIWPAAITENEAEVQELIVHIHFDAKYKIKDWLSVLGSIEEDDEKETKAERTDQGGTYKHADLLKMHTYRDAIRRTAGAYVIYPGDDNQHIVGFHELLPSIGAFAVSPTNSRKGLGNLKSFLKDVIDHLMNRATQREKMSLRVYQTYQSKPDTELKETIPEAYGKERASIPDDVYVLVGYYRGKDHLDWIRGNRQYNVRTEDARGSIQLGVGESTAQYLLLHSSGELNTQRLFRITGKGPKVYSGARLSQPGYSYQPSQQFYLVYSISEEIPEEFRSITWDVSKLRGYQTNRGSALPFAVTLTNLMSSVVK
jgi:hypothetical protein